MADQLYLSYWLRGFTQHNMFEHFENVLRQFPFSRLSPHGTLRVYAFELVEPPLAEAELLLPEQLDRLLQLAREHPEPDYAWEVETCWDLWQWDQEWHLRPTRVRIQLFGPLFETEYGEQVRIEFGPDAYFLPPAVPCPNLAPVGHNIRSVLHLASDLDQKLPVEKRLLWSESEANLVTKLEQTLREIGQRA